MKLLVTLAALGLSSSVLAQSVISNDTSSAIISRDASTVSSNTSGNPGSVMLDNQSSVTSSVTTDGTGNTTNSIVGRTGSMCSAVHKGQRCEISCQAPQVAQCAKDENAAGPACFCS
jgi:hypothetical protein